MIGKIFNRGYLQPMDSLDEFKQFIRTTRMTHIYKPVMLQAVLQRGGAATKEQIAADIVSRDVLQHEHYRRNIVDQMPGKRLVRNYGDRPVFTF